MDQLKIGRFISELRKEKNMTQTELAELIGVTDRAVSKWENGRGLPDISLIRPLCEALSVSANELLCGERIEKEEIEKKSEETIINTLEYSKKSVLNIKRIAAASIGCIFFLFISVAVCFSLDISRMIDNRPVLFSTWGFEYAPPVDLKDELIELSIKEHILQGLDSEGRGLKDEKGFTAFKIYLIDEKDEGIYDVYAWVLAEKFYLDGDVPAQDSGWSNPSKFVVEKQEGRYVVTGELCPRDGSRYVKDLKTIFPYKVRKQIKTVHEDGTYERLRMQIDEQVALYYRNKY